MSRRPGRLQNQNLAVILSSRHMKANAGPPSHLAAAAHALIYFPACFLLFVTIK